MKRYNPSDIEPKWQKFWDEQGTYTAHNDSDKPKYYALSFFPYPSGAGLHIGHVRNFTITDTAARFKRMTGFEVLHPMGWDSFGLPAENYAIKTGTPPQVTTKQNTDNFRQQAKNLGLSIDWTREFGSSDPTYYKWTQWFFLLLYQRGLAYRKESLQFWCETDKTVLANEQVEAGRCWRCGNEVTKKSLNQWFFKITDYADRLEADLDKVDWPHGITTMQRNWIGRKQGVNITYQITNAGKPATVTCFTTHPHTNFGATFVVIAPEHPLAQQIINNTLQPIDGASHAEEVAAYVKKSLAKTDIERQEEGRKKTGAFTGLYAENTLTGRQMPIWVADFALMGFGTGAVVGVPAHDERDAQFAATFNLPVLEVVEPVTGEPLPDAEFRRSVYVIVRNPKTNEFLTLNWGPKMGGSLFIGGGRENNEDPETTARREVLEETGYKNLKFVAQTGKMHAHYFAYSKNVAREIEAYGLLFDLTDDKQVATKLEDNEKNKFRIEWVPQNSVEARVIDPAHAAVYQLLVKGEPYTGEGIMVNSGKYDGMPSSLVREKLAQDLVDAGHAEWKTSYKIRDWLISRQRYWGAPIPIIHCPTDGVVPVPEDQLPVILPEMHDFHPTGDGRSPLAKNRAWVEVDCPKCGGKAERETDTMDGFACSSWYALRFADPHNNQAPFDKKLMEHWAPVDLYIGGAEHAVMHLLYARMWTKVMFDAGITSFDEPFTSLRNQGMLLAADGTKFSKSKGNGVDPDEIIKSGYGADALRTVILFLAPFDQKTPWSPEALGGVHRFLNRVWTLAQEVAAVKSQAGSADNPQILRAVHHTIRRVSEDMRVFGYNTAIAALMELINELYKLRETQPIASHVATWRWAVKTIGQLLAPFAPHLAEELWHQCDGEGSVHVSHWPVWDDQLLINKTITIVVQVNGKVRAKLEVPADAAQAAIEAGALADEHVRSFVGDKKPRVVYVPGRLINIVV